MTQTEIHRFDYNKPPPGYLDDWLGMVVNARRWAQHKAHNDPPGLTTRRGPHGAGFIIGERNSPIYGAHDSDEAARAAAWAWYDRRLALFALSDAAEGLRGTATASTAWPRCLTWSDAQVTEVERWLVDSTTDLPEVLGGSAPGDPNADDPPGTYSPIETSAAADDGPHVCTGCGPCVAFEAEIEAEERNADEIAEIEAEIDDKDEFMDDGLCPPLPQSESGDPTGRDWNRQVEEHNATTLPLLDFSAPPPGYAVDCYPHEKASDPPTSFGVALAGARPLCLFADEGEAVAAAWSDYKLSHDPPGMWCGFSRSLNDLDNCSIRVGVHACGSRWELWPDITVPYEGFTVKARAWAWAWYDRRHALMAKIPTMVTSLRADRRGPYPSRALAQRLAFAQRLVERAPFHRVLCWHDEWVAEVEAWIECPSHLPEALRG